VTDLPRFEAPRIVSGTYSGQTLDEAFDLAMRQLTDAVDRYVNEELAPRTLGLIGDSSPNDEAALAAAIDPYNFKPWVWDLLVDLVNEEAVHGQYYVFSAVLDEYVKVPCPRAGSLTFLCRSPTPPQPFPPTGSAAVSREAPTRTA
jgi:hypothetical protein